MSKRTGEKKMYHYTESGLDNVWLENGYKIHDTPYGRSVSVGGADQLHEMLALCLTKKEGRLTGKELRFLRTMLLLSQESLAKMTGVTEGAVSLWERTGKVPKSGDALARLLVMEKLKGDGSVTEVIDRINTVDRLVNQQVVARARQHKWTAKAQAAKPDLAEA
jgi:putative transcriptional regulator